MSNDYTVYMHTNLSNGLSYVGITRKRIEERWINGDGYAQNKKFYKDINQYGWNGFAHKVIAENLNYLQARELETSLIQKYNTINNGYNNTYSLASDRANFDFHDFTLLDNKKHPYTPNVDYFTRIPNDFIRCNLKNDFGLSRIFLMVYILIDRNRTLENKSHISIGQVLSMCGYKHDTKRKPKIFYETVKSLVFLETNHFIETDIDMYGLSYKDLIEIRIIQENFDACENFTKLYGRDLDRIMSIDAKPTKESILLVFLYICSYIGCRSKKDDGSEYDNAKDNPEAFFKSLEIMAREISMSKDTINQCIECLTSNKKDKPLLIKKEVGSIPATKSQPPKNVPNIYVLNKNGYQQEIKWALDKMLEVYGVKNFEQKKGN